MVSFRRLAVPVAVRKRFFRRTLCRGKQQTPAGQPYCAARRHFSDVYNPHHMVAGPRAAFSVGPRAALRCPGQGPHTISNSRRRDSSTVPRGVGSRGCILRHNANCEQQRRATVCRESSPGRGAFSAKRCPPLPRLCYLSGSRASAPGRWCPLPSFSPWISMGERSLPCPGGGPSETPFCTRAFILLYLQLCRLSLRFLSNDLLCTGVASAGGHLSGGIHTGMLPEGECER